MKKVLTALTLLFCAVCFAAADTAAMPKYVFLFIGDGMSIPQRMTAEEFSNFIGRGELTMNNLPFHATTRTAAANTLVTDSAAAATSIACGIKTNSGKLGVDPFDNPEQSVAELARDNGKKIGIITTVTMNHATPGGFYAHRENRNLYFEIGLDMVDSGFDFFGGGGMAYNSIYSPNLFERLETAGYRLVEGYEGMNTLENGEKVYVLANGKNDKVMPFAIDNKGETPTLAELTEAAIYNLDNPDGFFIMIEGGQIDTAGHANEAGTNIYETMALDDAVRVAMDFYAARPDETLIIVTGDHETGGMSMGFAGTGYAMYPERLANQKCSIDAFAAMVAKKNGADFEDLKPLITENFGLLFDGSNDPMAVTDEELKDMQKLYKNGYLHHSIRVIMNNKAGIGWTTGAHSGIPVLTTSIGVGAELFSGLIENTDIAIRLKSII